MCFPIPIPSESNLGTVEGTTQPFSTQDGFYTDAGVTMDIKYGGHTYAFGQMLI